MACYSPLTAWQTVGGDVVFAERGDIRRELVLPCGNCIGCRIRRSQEWAVRVMHEASMYESNCFVTLTYDDDHVPFQGQLVYSHFQKFMKRLRARVGPVRFYMCGEYGEKFWRPHFHACLFGFGFPDKVLFKRMPSGCDIFTSPLLSELWIDGFSSIGELTLESAAYVARYCIKKINGRDAESHYCRTDFVTGEIYYLEPEFGHMSLKPGIGARWIDRYTTDVYPMDKVMSGSLGAKPPRYYDKRLVMLDPDTAEFMELVRYRKSFASSIDSTVDRLRVREIVTRARLSFKCRNLE